MYSSNGAVHMRLKLLGGRTASTGSGNAIADMAVNSGVPAVPATLQFAKFLSWNASDTANRFQGYCFKNTKTSSSVLNSFSNDIQGMVKQINVFLAEMENYATPVGIKAIESKVLRFVDSAEGEIMDTVMKYVDEEIDKIAPNQWPTSETSLAQKGQSVNVTGVIDDVSSLLTELMTVLPSVVSTLKSARTEVSAVATGMDSIFKVFKVNGPPIFVLLADSYKKLWIGYFVLFAIINLSLISYAFWAAGWCKRKEEQQPGSSTDYVPPATFREKCMSCFSCCCACFNCCSSDSYTCLWTVVIIVEIICLLMFVISIVLCLMSGIQTFVLATCAQIYILADTSICTSSLGYVQKWLSTFLDTSVDLDQYCESQYLLTCYLIGAKIKSWVIYECVAAILASMLTFQVIIETAAVFERTKYLKLIDELKGGQ
jgi:hypothetical protein